jgi:FkbM family methyltransferase
MRYLPLLKRLIGKTLPPYLCFRVKKIYYLRAVKSFSEADAEPIKYLVKRGDFVLDIGANLGWYTRILSSLVGGQGKVYSIEPIPETFELLSAITKKLRLSNVELINCAISETDGSVSMEVPLYDYGGPNFYQARVAENPCVSNQLGRWKVDTRSLDSLFFEVAKNITFIKCDVEGHELSVVKGADEFLAKSKPSWLLEISEDPDADHSHSKELFDRLREHGYAPYWFDGRTLKERRPGDKPINYFFLQDEHVRQVRGLIR